MPRHPFDVTWHWDLPPQDAARRVVPDVTGTLSMAGFSPSQQTPDWIVYERTYSPGLFWIAYILFFPLGLLLLLGRPKELVTLTFGARDDGSSEIRAYGENKNASEFFIRLAENNPPQNE